MELDYDLILLPPQPGISGTHDQHAYMHDDACSMVGLRPLIAGDSAYGVLGYCARWDCVQVLAWFDASSDTLAAHA